MDYINTATKKKEKQIGNLEVLGSIDFSDHVMVGSESQENKAGPKKKTDYQPSL